MKLIILLSAMAAVVVARDRNVRVEFKLQDYTNNGGILYDGSQCDRRGHCDPKMSGYVDTEKPLNPWPGPKPINSWTPIFQVQDKDVANVNKIVSRDVCSSRSGTPDYSKANLRIDLVNSNRDTREMEIEQFECLSGRDVASSESRAVWSPPKPCDAKFNPRKVQLQYSWRAFEVDDRECGRLATGSGSGSGSNFGSSSNTGSSLGSNSGRGSGSSFGSDSRFDRFDPVTTPTTTTKKGFFSKIFG